MRSFLLVLISVVLSVAITSLFLQRSDSDTARETAHERVMRTGTIRCGYAMWPPYAILKDPKTGELTGIFVDIIEKMADKLHLEVEWAEEPGWGTYIEGLQAGRYDLFCAPVWRVAEHAAQLQYGVALNYSAEHFYVRKDDLRFDETLKGVNDPSVKLAALDGEWSQFIARDFFPKAQRVEHPQLADLSMLLMDVMTKKADGVFLPPDLAKDFAAKNPGAIRQVTKKPFQIYPNSFAAAMGEADLIAMTDTALIEMLNSGEIDGIVEKYEPDRSIFMPAAKPYTYSEPKALP